MRLLRAAPKREQTAVHNRAGKGGGWAPCPRTFASRVVALWVASLRTLASMKPRQSPLGLGCVAETALLARQGPGCCDEAA